MSQPLGTAVGNALDVAEAISVLRGDEAGRLHDLAVLFAARALTILEGRAEDAARDDAERALGDGSAAETFARMIEAQGGDPRVVEDPAGVLPAAPVRREVPAPRDGWLAAVDAEAVGRAAMALGAGRVRKGDPVDPAVGVEFFPKVGNGIRADDVLARVHARDADAADAAAGQVLAAITWSPERVEPPPLLYRWVGGPTP